MDRFAIAIGVITALIAATVVGAASLLHRADLAHMHVNVALGFLLIGIALTLSRARQSRGASVVAAGAAVLAGASLVQQAWHVNLGIDALTFGGGMAPALHPLGQLAPNTALSFLFAACAIIALNWPAHAGFGLLVGGVLAWAVTGIGVAACIGYFAGVEGAYAWSDMQAMSVAAAGLFVLVGAGLAAISAHRELSVPHERVRWLPSHLMLGSFIVSMIFWYALGAREHAFSVHVMTARAEEMRVALLARLRQGLDALEHTAGRWERRGGLAPADWDSNAEAMLGILPELRVVEWLDRDSQVRRLSRSQGGEDGSEPWAPSDAQARADLTRAGTAKQRLAAGPFDLRSGESGISVLVPLFAAGSFDGFVVGVFSTDGIVERAMPTDIMGFDTRVSFVGDEGLRLKPVAGNAADGHGTADFRFLDLGGTVVVRCGDHAAAGRRSSLPEVILAAGCLAGILAAGAVRFGADARGRARTLAVATLARDTADEKREESERRWKTTFEYLPVPAGLLDQDGVYLDWNRAAEQALGYLREEIVGQRFLESGLVHPDSLDRAAAEWAQALLHKPIGPVELVLTRKDGAPRTAEVFSFTLDRGESVEVVAVAIDTTERNVLMEALYAREERFRRVFEHGPIGVIVALPDLAIVAANERSSEMLGCPTDVLAGARFQSFVHPDDVGEVEGCVDEILGGKAQTHQLEARCVSQAGSICHAAMTIAAIRNNDGSAANVLVMLQDASERWQAELQRDRIFRVALEMMGITDVEGRILAVNPRVERVLGYDARDMLGLPYLDLIHEADVARCVQARDEVARGEHVSDVELRVRCKDNTYRCLSWNAIPVLEYDVVYWTARDVTDKKRIDAELNQHRDEVAHALRVLTLGEMASQVCHEVNQPLGAIVNYANGLENLLLLRGVGDDDMLRVIRRIAEQGQRAGDLVNSIRGFVRSGASKREPIELNDLIRRALDLLRVRTRDDVDLRLALTEGLPCVVGDATQIEQAIVNVVENAVDAARKNAKARKPTVSIRTLRSSAHSVEIEVADSGKGVPLDELGRIFDAFFTTKENGLGLGLAICRTLVEAHKGRITLTNSAAGGAVVRIVFSVSDRDTARA